MMLTIDRALNAIWRVRRPRPIAQRVLVYWAAVTFGPLFAGASLAVTSYAVSASRGFVDSMPRGMGLVVWTAEFVLHAVSVAALFHYVPNTRVRWRHALAGGLFVAVGMAAAKRLITFYFSAVPSFSMIYGAFATLPIFLVWIYLGWVIVLLGAVIAAYAPLLGRRLSRWTEAPGSQFHLALALLGALNASRRSGRHGLTEEQLATAVRADLLQSGPVIDHLVALDWVGRLAEGASARYVLLCDPETTDAEPLVARLLLEPQPDLASLWKRAGFAEMKVGEILAR
jgi:membrane protein